MLTRLESGCELKPHAVMAPLNSWLVSVTPPPAEEYHACSQAA